MDCPADFIVILFTILSMACLTLHFLLEVAFGGKFKNSVYFRCYTASFIDKMYCTNGPKPQSKQCVRSTSEDTFEIDVQGKTRSNLLFTPVFNVYSMQAYIYYLWFFAPFHCYYLSRYIYIYIYTYIYIYIIPPVLQHVGFGFDSLRLLTAVSVT